MSGSVEERAKELAREWLLDINSWQHQPGMPVEGVIQRFTERIASALRDAELLGYDRAKEQAAKVYRATISDFLGLHKEQRSYSWHDIQDALEKADSASSARREGASE